MKNTPNIDRLGELLAQIADLTREAETIKSALRTMGDGSYEGDLFRATVSTSERDTLDMKAVREHLSRQFIQAHTNTTTVTAVKVVARTGKAA